MKKILLFLLLLLPLTLLAQYPPTGNKMRLGWQTTGDGLIYRGSGAPSYTPSTRNDAYSYVDTVANRFYHYENGAWRDLSDEKYIHLIDASILATPIKDSLATYDRIFIAMEITSGASSDRGVQLPVTGLDETYAGRVVRVSSMDSSGTYTAFVASSGPDGLLVDGVLVTTYYLNANETAEFQLYIFDGDVYQWRLIHTNDIEPIPADNITGTGTTNYISKFTGTYTLGNSNLTDNGTILDALLPLRLKSYATVGLPTGTQGYTLYNTTFNQPQYHDGTSYRPFGEWYRSGNNIYFNTGQVSVGTSTPASNAALTVQGTGTGSSTFSFVARNSSATPITTIYDNGIVSFGSGTKPPYMYAANLSSGGGFPTLNASGMEFKMSLEALGSNNGGFNFSGNVVSGSGFLMQLNPVFALSSGSGTLDIQRIRGTITQSGSSSHATNALSIITDINSIVNYTGINVSTFVSREITSTNTYTGVLVAPKFSQSGGGTGTTYGIIVSDEGISSAADWRSIITKNNQGRSLSLEGIAPIYINPSAITQNDAISRILVLNPSTGFVQYRDASSLATYTGFTPTADSGSGSNVASGGTLTLTGGYGINTSVSGTTVTTEVDTGQIATQYDLSQLADLNGIFSAGNEGATIEVQQAEATNPFSISNYMTGVWVGNGGDSVATVVRVDIPEQVCDASALAGSSVYLCGKFTGTIAYFDNRDGDSEQVNLLLNGVLISESEEGANSTAINAVVKYEYDSDEDEWIITKVNAVSVNTTQSIVIQTQGTGSTVQVESPRLTISNEVVLADITENNAATDILTRNESTGVVERIDVSEIKPQPKGNIIFVSKEGGNDTLGLTNNSIFNPLRTPWAARNIATQQDLIYVMPSEYRIDTTGAVDASPDSTLWCNCNYYFSPGTKIKMAGYTGDKALFHAKTGFIGTNDTLSVKGALDVIEESDKAILFYIQNTNGSGNSVFLADFKTVKINRPIALGDTIQVFAANFEHLISTQYAVLTASFSQTFILKANRYDTKNTGNLLWGFGSAGNYLLEFGDINIDGASGSNNIIHIDASSDGSNIIVKANNIQINTGGGSVIPVLFRTRSGTQRNIKASIQVDNIEISGSTTAQTPILFDGGLAHTVDSMDVDILVKRLVSRDSTSVYLINQGLGTGTNNNIRISVANCDIKTSESTLIRMNQATSFGDFYINGNYILRSPTSLVNYSGLGTNNIYFQNLRYNTDKTTSIITTTKDNVIRLKDVSLKNDGVTNKVSGVVNGSYFDLNKNGLVLLNSVISEGYINQTSTSSPITLSVGDNLINQGGTQASFTFNLPASPIDGAICTLSFANAVTSCTIAGGTILGTSVTTALAGDRFEYKYYANASSWIRLK